MGRRLHAERDHGGRHATGEGGRAVEGGRLGSRRAAARGGEQAHGQHEQRESEQQEGGGTARRHGHHLAEYWRS